MDHRFFDLRGSHNPHRWHLPLVPKICVGPPDQLFMYGGVGLAAAIEALEATCERPVVWATAQYLSFARPPSVLDLDVRVFYKGRHTTQARIAGHVGESEIITINAALGARPGGVSHQWAKMPDAPRPEDCERVQLWPDHGDNFNRRVELRMPKGALKSDGVPTKDGRLALWARTVEEFEMCPSLLAIFADYVPSAIGPALGESNSGSSSLDNTLRIRRVVPTRWVFCDIQITGMHAGFAHGDMRLFAETGELMATASQSMVVRRREE
ncbi:MAG: thioesterase family protein [Hyphomicrobiales bacterium]|nr:thioesterase family protein [Hyphomicrobiales bacterium]